MFKVTYEVCSKDNGNCKIWRVWRIQLSNKSEVAQASLNEISDDA